MFSMNILPCEVKSNLPSTASPGLRLAAEEMKLVVQLPWGEIAELRMCVNRCVYAIKLTIHQKFLVLPSNQILMHNGRVLIDNLRIDECGILCGSTLYLLTKDTVTRTDPRLIHVLNNISNSEEADKRGNEGSNARAMERDRKLTSIESKPRGMIALSKFYKQMDDFIWGMTGQKTQKHMTIIPKNAEGPSCSPLPRLDSVVE